MPWVALLFILLSGRPAMADYAIGDSLTDAVGYAGQGVSGYSTQLNTRLSTTFQNIAHGGDMVGDQANKVYAVTPAAGDRSIVMLRVNDQRIYGTDPAKRVVSNDGLRSILVWLGTASRQIARGGSSESGSSWVNTSTNAIGRTASTAGDYTTFTVAGTSVYVSVQIGNSGGSYSISIDGVDKGTFSAGVSGITTYNGWGNNERLHRFAGLPAGIHVIKVVVATGPVTVEFAAGNYQPARPAVYVGNTIKASSAAGMGYAAWGGSAANVIAYNADEAAMIAELRSDGLNIWPIDVCSILNDTTDLNASDGLHPSQSGYDKLANAFYGAITAFQSLPSGFTLTPTPAWTGSDGNLYAGADAAHLSLLISQPVTISAPPPPPPPPPPPQGGIAFSSFTLGAANTASIPVNNAASANYAILAVASRGVQMGSWSATYDGVAMTPITGFPIHQGGSNDLTAFYINNPSAGSKTVSIGSASGNYRAAVYLFTGAVGGAPTGLQSSNSGANPASVTSDASSIVLGQAVFSDGDPGTMSGTTDSHGAISIGGYSFGHTAGATNVAVTFSGSKSSAAAFSIK